MSKMKIELRNIKIKQLRKIGKKYRELSNIFNLSIERTRQIVTGYNSPSSKPKHPSKLKNLTTRKLKYLNLPVIKYDPTLGGRDRTREIIRARDNWTCQKCFKKWKKGQRRLDVHHIDEKKFGKTRSKGINKYDKNNTDKLITLCHKCHFNLEVTKERMRRVLITPVV